ncbi:MAG: LysM peptidoglycan-binding domain-containing protein [Spirochaetaceae bacterium]|jgi:hypothetical protein|nr:LysM peptidoglycan-binding domain-containing protein [Spirochaetaceae bacterium]
MSSLIGIKVADGAFFPVLTEGTVARKRLVLTTAHDDQTSVQIDFYKASSISMNDASYIGTLLIEKIQKKNKGSPSIELTVSLNDDGEFSASAYDIDHPEEKDHHTLTVSLSQEVELNNFDDIDLVQEDMRLKEYVPNDYATNIKTSKPLIIIIAAVILLALAAFGLWFFVLRSRPTADSGAALTGTPAAEAVVEPPPAMPVPGQTAEQVKIPPPQQSDARQEPPVIKAPDVPVKAGAPASRKRPPAPVSSYKAPSVIPAGGISYKLRWGDTLWDVSQAFYRTPWRYKYLANYNSIRNPDRIMAGRTIKIPPLPK